MVDLYCTLIINKRRAFDTVPSKLKDDVEKRLTELGYDTDGNPVTLEALHDELLAEGGVI